MSSKKKPKLLSKCESKSLPRESPNDIVPRKRSKTALNPEEELKRKLKQNFMEACKQVSYNAFFDYKMRFLLIFLPPCISTGECKHLSNTYVKEISPKAEELFMIEARTHNMWLEALEVCVLCSTPTQYLSAKLLKEVVEIMLNVHEDKYAENPVSDIIDKCQQILMQNFSIHPPCFMKNLRKCYQDFLTSPMSSKDKSATNRTEYEYEQGVVKYCFNRLEYELSSDSVDGSLVDKNKNIPEEMKDSVQGFHWQKEKFEIYETLERTERIDRLMSVLESIVELLQFDLVICNSRYLNNTGRHSKSYDRPLLTSILWSDIKEHKTEVESKTCNQILRIFVNFIHLKYSQKHINIMTIWVNTVIETFYLFKIKHNGNYPNTKQFIPTFAKEFYKIIAEKPHGSIVKIIEVIKPDYMRYLIGNHHVKNILPKSSDSIIKNVIDFIKSSMWNDFPLIDEELNASIDQFFKPIKFKKQIRALSKMCRKWNTMEISAESNVNMYSKLTTEIDDDNDNIVNCNHVIHTLYVTLDAYLKAFNVQKVQDTIDILNAQIIQDDGNTSTISLSQENDYYHVSDDFIRDYRSIYQLLKELILLLHEQNKRGDLPKIMRIFKKIDCLDF